MELEERLSELELVHDWQGLVDVLEEGIAAESNVARKAELHLKLGRVLDAKFLAGVRALKHFQSAYKLNAASVESLQAARGVYWALGKLSMVHKLLELELKAVGADSARTASLLLELGDVLLDEDDWAKGAAAYARSASVDASSDASACLGDAQLDTLSWQAHLAALLRGANESSDGHQRSRLLLRASRIARRFAPDESEEMLGRAYAAYPMDVEVAATYEGTLVKRGQSDLLEKQQLEILGRIEDKDSRSRNAMVFGSRWVSRHQNAEAGTRFLDLALQFDPTCEAAFLYMREAIGTKSGEWDRLLSIADTASLKSVDGTKAFFLAQLGTISWRNKGDIVRAKIWFGGLGAVAPRHRALLAFEKQIGKTGLSCISCISPSGECLHFGDDRSIAFERLGFHQSAHRFA